MVFGRKFSLGESKKFAQRAEAIKENIDTRNSDEYKDWWESQGRAETRRWATGQREDFAKKKGMSLEEFNIEEQRLRKQRESVQDKPNTTHFKLLKEKFDKEYNEFTEGFSVSEDKYALDQFNQFTQDKQAADESQRSQLQAEATMFSPEGIKRKRRKDTILGGMADEPRSFLTQGGALLGR